MELTLQVWDVTNSSLVRTLERPHQAVLVDDLTVPGQGVFHLDLTSSADVDAVRYRRKVRWLLDGTPVFTSIVADRPTVVRDGSTERPYLKVEGPGLLGALGTSDKGGAALYPYGWPGGRNSNPRYFGPMSFDYDDSWWTEPPGGGPSGRAGWPDRLSQNFSWTERALFRRQIAGVPNRAGPAQMIFTASTNAEAVIYLNESPVLTYERGRADIVVRDVEYDGEPSILLIDVESPGGSGTLAWSWYSLKDDPDEEGRLIPGVALFRTFNSSTFQGPTAPTPPFWTHVNNYAEYPGVSPWFVLERAVTEAKGRGALGAVTLDGVASDSQDSAGQPWAISLAQGFQWSNLGRLLDQLVGWGCEPQMTPDGTLKLFNRRGTDRTATVELLLPYAAEVTGEGPAATVVLFETPDGAGEAVNATGVAEYERLEDVVSYGTALKPRSAAPAITGRLGELASPKDEIRLDSRVDGQHVPYLDVELGDTVTAVGRDGPAPYRVSQWTIAQDQSGFLAWELRGVPA